MTSSAKHSTPSEHAHSLHTGHKYTPPAAMVALESSLTEYLRLQISNPQTHARFLNTVSLLEHIGSRKIMTSQSGPEMTLPMLQHLAEETRHALFFRKQAERLAGHPLNYGGANVYAPPAARMYIGRLDAEITREVAGHSPHLPYLYVSAVIEVRALWFFHLYDAILSQEHAGISLKGIIAEEKGHLDDMQDKLALLDDQYAKRFAHFQQVEDRLFHRLLPKLLAG